MSRDSQKDMTVARLVTAMALALGLSLLVFRVVILSGDLRGLSPVAMLLAVLAGSIQDWLLTLGFLGVGLVLADRVRAAPSSWRMVLVTLLALFLVLWGLANIYAVRFLGGPVTQTWIAFSEVLDGTYMTASLFSALTLPAVMTALAALLLFGVIVCFLTVVFTLLDLRRAALVLVAIGPLVLATAADQASEAQTSPGKRQNAMLALAASLFASGQDGIDLGVRSAEAAGRAVPSDLLHKPAFAGVRADTIPRPAPPARPIENLVLVVLESTGIRAAGPYPDAVGATPNLDRYAAEMGLAVSDVYAHAPSSALSLASLIAGLEPDLWSKSMTVDRDDLAVEGLASVMRARVARSGYFDSSDKRFHNAGGFALRAGYDFVHDLNDWDCTLGGVAASDRGGEPLDKAHDLCTFRAAADWVGSQADAPFFLTIWTGMAHYPYMAGDDPQPFVDDPERNAYLNAVRTTDAALGFLVEDLRARDLLDRTLIVVVGDHGEAFGEHGQYGHATGLWEENLRVPLVLLNPQLFPEGQSARMLASLVDVAPTIVDLFDLPAPAAWHGTSLFAEDRPDGVFLFAPWAGLQIGFRQGDRKYIYDANTGKSLLYDLAADPLEANDLSASQPEALARARSELAAWVDWQTRFRSVRGQAGAAETVVTAAAELAAPDPPEVPQVTVTIRAAGTMFQTPPTATLRIDGTRVGSLVVTGALSNAEAAVPDEALNDSFADYLVTLPLPACARQLEIEFLNDEWAGEGLTGDSNLFIESVTIGDRSYAGRSFHAMTDRVGGDYWGKFRMVRNGSMAVDLDVSPDCLSAQFAAP